ncbi:MAG: sulfatase-like hydrolase/transferase [Candidatus Syntrophoarchaeum sp.]|nr:sulfatase-like hydrolase/transferase [Candidatus Syntrophoarchaeum sp.]
MQSILQIAPTLADFFGVHLNSQVRSIEQILNFAYSRNPKVVVLVVIDSLDFRFYSDFADELGKIHELVERDGLLFECETVSSHTTPAIASILTGLQPDAHGILTSEDVGKSKINSILEILEDEGYKTAAAIETKGAEPLWGRISYVFAVDDREDIIEYDKLIKAHTISVLKKQDLRLMFSHLRAIDRFAHRGEDLSVAAKAVNENVRAIATAVSERNGMLVICGDHETHVKERQASQEKATATVPLIVCCP